MFMHTHDSGTANGLDRPKSSPNSSLLSAILPCYGLEQTPFRHNPVKYPTIVILLPRNVLLLQWCVMVMQSTVHIAYQTHKRVPIMCLVLSICGDQITQTSSSDFDWMKTANGFICAFIALLLCMQFAVNGQLRSSNTFFRKNSKCNSARPSAIYAKCPHEDVVNGQTESSRSCSFDGFSFRPKMLNTIGVRIVKWNKWFEEIVHFSGLQLLLFSRFAYE